MNVTLWCTEKNLIAEIPDDPGNPDTTPTPCRGPDCPKYDGGWCPHLLNGRSYEFASARGPSRSRARYS